MPEIEMSHPVYANATMRAEKSESARFKCELTKTTASAKTGIAVETENNRLSSFPNEQAK